MNKVILNTNNYNFKGVLQSEQDNKSCINKSRVSIELIIIYHQTLLITGKQVM